MIKVSALVTTYKSSRFMRGCLEDLTAQTLFIQGALEIVVVISGSPENEHEIVAEYQQRFPRQISVVTTEREPMYTAWNRGIALAQGEYLTNANTDDRHRSDAIELLARYLDTHPRISLVYSNCYVSHLENETFEQNNKQENYLYGRFFAPHAPLAYQFGPHPLWRKKIHSTIGLFSTKLKAAGDYEFNLRFAETLRAERIDGPPLGLYLAHPQAISFKDDTMVQETSALYDEYRTPQKIERFYENEGVRSSHQIERAQLFHDFATRALQYYPAWFCGRPHADITLAKTYFIHAIGLNPSSEETKANLALCEFLLGNKPRAYELLAESPLKQARDNLRIMQDTSVTSPSYYVFPSALGLAAPQNLTFEGIT